MQLGSGRPKSESSDVRRVRRGERPADDCRTRRGRWPESFLQTFIDLGFVRLGVRRLRLSSPAPRHRGFSLLPSGGRGIGSRAWSIRLQPQLRSSRRAGRPDDAPPCSCRRLLGTAIKQSDRATSRSAFRSASRRAFAEDGEGLAAENACAHRAADAQRLRMRRHRARLSSVAPQCLTDFFRLHYAGKRRIIARAAWMATQTWIVGRIGAWFTAANWTSGIIPSTGDTVIVGSGMPRSIAETIVGEQSPGRFEQRIDRHAAGAFGPLRAARRCRRSGRRTIDDHHGR